MTASLASRTQLLPPSTALAPYVQAIAVRRPSDTGPALPVMQCFPANVLGALTVLHRGDWVDGDTGRSLHDVELAGPRLMPAKRAYGNNPSITTVLLRPGVLSWLFDLPASDWVNHRGPATDIIGQGTAQVLQAQMSRATITAAQVWIVEQQLHCWVEKALARRIWQPPPRIPALTARVGDWAGTATSSARQLQRRVGEATGLSPKALLRVERLHEGLRRVADGEPLADVAASCGFSHAAHMVREFRMLTGLSPAGVRRDASRHEGLPWRMASAGTESQAFTQST